jgi:hypothetical protein
MKVLVSFFKQNPDLAAGLFFLAFWTSLLWGSGTLLCGYQLVDDHEILRINEQLHAPGENLVTVARSFIGRDLVIRFRPLYYVLRILETRMFGDRLALWSFWNALLAVLTSFLLYRFYRLLALPWHGAVVFSVLPLLGQQASAWWMRGPAETPGTFLTAVCLVLAVQSVDASGHRSLRTPGFLCAAAAMSLCKESFALLLPAVACLRLWRIVDRDKCSWPRALRRDIVAVLLLACLAGGVVFTASRTITASLGYAGVDSPSLAVVKRAIRQTLSLVRTTEIPIVAFFMAVFFISSVERNKGLSAKSLSFLKDLAPILVFSGLWIAPQIVLYAKSGLGGRYLLPVALGVSMLCLWSYAHGLRRYPYFRSLFLGVILACASWTGLSTFRQARLYSANSDLLEAFLESIDAHSTDRNRILVVVDPVRHYEASLSVLTYLRLKAGKDEESLYVHSQFVPPYVGFQNDLANRHSQEEWYKNRTLASLSGLDTVNCVAILPGVESAFVAEAGRWIARDDFARQTFPADVRHLQTEYVLYLRKSKADAGKLNR